MLRRPLTLLAATAATLLLAAPLTGAAHAAANVAATPSQSTTAITTSEGEGFSTYGFDSISAKVAKVPPGKGTPTGSVDWYDGESYVTTTPLARGKAVLPGTALEPGDHELSAQYGGDDSTLGSSSDTVSVHVFKVYFHETLKAKPNPATSGKKLTLTATVKSPTKEVSPEGHYVSFSYDGEFLDTAQIVKGKAVLVLPTGLPPGDHEVVVIYPDDGEHISQSGTSIMLHVD